MDSSTPSEDLVTSPPSPHPRPLGTSFASARPLAAALVATALVAAAPSSARAAPPRPTSATPTLFGAQRLDPGTAALGMTTGYPKTGTNLHVGLLERFDIAFLIGVTYGDELDGNRQNLGADFHVPLRWTPYEEKRLAFGIRIAPYFMIGESGPAFSIGGDLAFLFDIALPKVFKLILGPELRTGFATREIGNDRRTGYDGRLVMQIGLETLVAREWAFGFIFRGGAQWGTGGLSEDGVFGANVFFGYVF